VAFKGRHVVLYRGRAGGMLFWDPEVVQVTKLERCRLTQVQQLAISKKQDFSDRTTADQFIARAQRNPAKPNTCATPTTTTSTIPSSTTSSSNPPPVTATTPAP
jgi:hypothetical protein